MLSFWILALASFVTLLANSDPRNGCTVEDLADFGNLLAQFVDEATIAQNSGANTDSFTTFVTNSMTEDFIYVAFEQDSGEIYLYYDSRDSYLSRWVYDYIFSYFGRIWFWASSGYGVCANRTDGTGGIDGRNATYISRGGDNLRGAVVLDPDINIDGIVRWTLLFSKNNQTSNEWKINRMDVEIVSDFGSFYVGNGTRTDTTHTTHTTHTTDTSDMSTTSTTNTLTTGANGDNNSDGTALIVAIVSLVMVVLMALFMVCYHFTVVRNINNTDNDKNYRLMNQQG